MTYFGIIFPTRFALPVDRAERDVFFALSTVNPAESFLHGQYSCSVKGDLTGMVLIYIFIRLFSLKPHKNYQDGSFHFF